jgi:hypothetical protein
MPLFSAGNCYEAWVTNRGVLSSEIETDMAPGSHSVLAPSRDLLFG